jgi:hypothetical protein
MKDFFILLFYALKQEFENEFFSFLLKKKGENDDKIGPRDECRPKCRSQGVTDNTK